MKKIYALILAVSPLLSFGQFEVILGKLDTIQAAYTDQEIKIKMYVKNPSTASEALDLNWALAWDFAGTNTPNWTNYVCEGILCYSPQVRAKEFNTTLNPGDSVEMYTYINMLIDTGSNNSCVHIFDPTDSVGTVQTVCIYGTATLDPAGVDDINEDAVLSQNAPNPFNNNSVINYELRNSGALKIQDLTGKMIREIPLEAGAGKVNVSQLNAGIYFYSLWENGQLLATKRMQVIN